jgi:CRP-like cAMP-binding protein
MALDSDITQMQANPVLALFDAEALRLIAFSSDVRQFRRDDVLFREGDVSDGGYFIVSGAVQLHTAERAVAYGPDALLGETALFTETKRPATATAVEATVARRLPRHLIRRVLAEFPHTAARVHTHLGSGVADVGEQLSRIHQMLPDEN